MTQEGDLIRHYKLEIEGKFVIPDFYIKSKGIMIEYDGRQHYEYVPHFHKDSYQGLINQVNRDKALEQYCLENGIKLLRIPYKDDNRLGEVIKAFLRDGKDITTKVEPKLLPAIIYG